MTGVDNDCNGYILGLEQLGGGAQVTSMVTKWSRSRICSSFLNCFRELQGSCEADLNFDQHVGVGRPAADAGPCWATIADVPISSVLRFRKQGRC